MLATDQPKGPDPRGVEAVNGFHIEAFAYQRDNPDCVFVSPLGIDERPLSDILDSKERMAELKTEIQEGASKVTAIRFPRDQMRWPTDEYWKRDEILSPGPGDAYGDLLPLKQVEDAAGAIRTDVGWRDYRLVLQADALAVFNPVFNNQSELSAGVRDEIDYAVMTHTPVYVFQDQNEDEKHRFLEWVGRESAMVTSERRDYIVHKDIGSVQDLLRRAAPPRT